MKRKSDGPGGGPVAIGNMPIFANLLWIQLKTPNLEQALDWFEALVNFGLSLAILLGIRYGVLWLLRSGHKQPQATSAEVFAAALKVPSLLWVLAGALTIGLEGLHMTERHTLLARHLVTAAVILSLAVMLNNLAMRGIAHLPFRMAGLSQTLLRLAIFSGGLLVMLRYWGISITPVLAGLGVGGLAVALALQDTLANFFAGVHLLLESPIEVGHYVRIGNEDEGTVTDIGWRTTRITTGANATIVVPNKNLSSASILNYSIPSERASAFLPITVSFAADMNEVEQVCLEAARQTEGVLEEPAPVFVADPGLTPTHMQFRLVFWVERQTAGGGVRTAVLRRLLTEFRKRGIPLPEDRRHS